MDVSKLDLSNPDVVEALRVLERDTKYNTRLKQFFKDAYPWQRTLANSSADYSVIGCVASNQTGKTEAVTAITGMHLLGEYPDWYTGKRFTKAVTVVAAGVNSNHNRIVLQEKLFGTANRNIESDVGTGIIPLDRIVEGSIIKARDGGITGCQVKHKCEHHPYSSSVRMSRDVKLSRDFQRISLLSMSNPKMTFGLKH